MFGHDTGIKGLLASSVTVRDPPRYKVGSPSKGQVSKTLSITCNSPGARKVGFGETLWEKLENLPLAPWLSFSLETYCLFISIYGKALDI